jgi:3-hydroxyisobutyrate dehydrogenase-like beta-hydroxyacid dehydrogenase
LTTAVSVIGLGNMGSALARALVDASYEVTVWNRTAVRAAPLAALGAQRASTAAEALAASPSTIVCVTRYEDVYDALDSEEAAGALEARTLINVGWGTPADARIMQAWVGERGGSYLDGGIPVYPSRIGRADTELVYAGPLELWEGHRALLASLGGASRHVGVPIESANVVALAIPGAYFHVSLGAFLEAAAYAGANGVPADALVSLTRAATTMLGDTVEAALVAISTRDYDTDEASLWISLDAMRMVKDAMNDAGQRGTELGAFVDVFERGLAAGLGDKAPASIYDLLRDGG